MGIGEPVRFEGKQGTDHQIPMPPPERTYPSELHFSMIKKMMIIMIVFFGGLPFVMFSPVIIFAFIVDWRAGFAMFIIPGITLVPIIIGFAIAIPMVYSQMQEAGKDDFAVIEESSIYIRHKPNRRMQARELRIPFSNIQDILIDPDEVEKRIQKLPKNNMQFLYSTPLPPIGGYYTALAKKENLVCIGLKEHIQINQIKPGLKWFVAKPEPHMIKDVFFNITIDRKNEFKEQFLKMVPGVEN